MSRPTGARIFLWALRLLTAAGLGLDAWVHFDLAPLYSGVRGDISEASLFRLEGAVAIVAALLVLAVGRRIGFATTFTVAASALGAVLLYRYVDVGRLGPLPNMYEPSWFAKKELATAAEAAATFTSAVGLLAVLFAYHRQRATAFLANVRWRKPLLAGGTAGLLAIGVIAYTAAAAVGAPSTAAPSANALAAGSSSQSGSVQQVSIVGNNSLRFVPSTVHLHTGLVRITLIDSGAYPHNIVIPALGVTSASVTGDPGGLRISFTVDFRHPGTYRFYCQYHVTAGMTGTFVVS